MKKDGFPLGITALLCEISQLLIRAELAGGLDIAGAVSGLAGKLPTAAPAAVGKH